MSEQQQGSKRNFYRHQISPQNAPSFTIPPRFLVAIEHPFIIEDVDKAIESLGGTSTVHAVCSLAFRHDNISDVGLASSRKKARSTRKALPASSGSNVQTYRIKQCRNKKYSTQNHGPEKNRFEAKKRCFRSLF